MCGIAGAAAAPGRPAPSAELLSVMADALAHRGPDGEGFHRAGSVGLAHRRLAIIDVAGGQNPLLDGQGRAALVFNGEIWNHRKLRAELEAAGCRPRSQSDGEVVLHGYLHWGAERLLRRLRGMFAFALHDLQHDTLLLARDPFGIKPLFVRESADGLLFGSELKAILAALPGRPAPDPTALLQCATLGFTLSPGTIWSGIRSLEPGTAALWRNGKLQVSRHHELRFEPGREAADAEELWRRLGTAVESHLMSEVPLGAFLSGGMDSSAIVAAMAQRAPPGGVDAVTVGILGGGLDERASARAVAAHLGVRLHEEEAAPDIADLLPRLAWHTEQPFGDSSAAPTWLVCGAARRHVTVALSGDGGDENFAGYRRIRYDVLEENLRRALPLSLRRGLLAPLGRAWPRAAWLPRPLRAGTLLSNLGRDWLSAYVHSLCRVPEERARALWRPEVLDSTPLRASFEGHAARVAGLDPLHRVLAMDFATWLPDDILVKADRMSMAHGLELRVPLLDTDFVEWAAGLPGHARLARGRGKVLLADAVRSRLPAGILDRPKQGFHLPVSEWLRGPLAGRLAEILAARQGLVFDLLRPERCAQLATEHASGQRDHGAELWSVLVLDAFLRDGPQAGARPQSAPRPNASQPRAPEPRG